MVRIVRMGNSAAAFSCVPVSILAMRMVPLVVVVLLEMLIVNGVVVVVVAMIAVVPVFVVMVVAVVVVVVATPMVSAVATVVVVGVLIFVVLVVVHAILIVVVVGCAAALVGLTLQERLASSAFCSCGAAAGIHGNGAVFLANFHTIRAMSSMTRSRVVSEPQLVREVSSAPMSERMPNQTHVRVDEEVRVP